MRHAKEKEEKTKREQLHATSLTKRQFKHRRSCVGSERERQREGGADGDKRESKGNIRRLGLSVKN